MLHRNYEVEKEFYVVTAVEIKNIIILNTTLRGREKFY